MINEEIETDKWRIFFKKPVDRRLDESYIELMFRLKNDPSGFKGISQEDLLELEGDIKDLSKWRKFRELKRDLEK